MHTNFCLESLKDKDHLEDLGEDERLVPEFILEKQGRIFLSSTVILSSHLCLPLHSGLSPSGLPTKTCLSSNLQINKVHESLCLIKHHATKEYRGGRTTPRILILGTALPAKYSPAAYSCLYAVTLLGIES